MSKDRTSSFACGPWLATFLSLCASQALPSAAQEAEVEAREAPPAGEPAAPATRTAKNLLFVELGGNGGVYSINYARFIGDDFMFRLGAEYFAFSFLGSEVSVFLAPIVVSYLGIGTADHKLELGVGAVLGYASTTGSELVSGGQGLAYGATGTIGYRYVPHDGGFTFNVGFTPIFGDGFFPGFGMGFGGVF